MPEYAVETRDLRIDYGDFTAVNSLNLQIPRGSVFGLVGPNGAGKTSTIRALAGLLEPTHGDIRVDGIDLAENPAGVFERLGYMPDLAPIIGDLSVREFLLFYAGMYRLSDPAERVAEALAQVKMTDAAAKLCSTLSRGMSQRVVLAKTLLHKPSVLLLDEPASGMDPLARIDLRISLEALAAEGATVLVSSHILSELAEMCTDLAILHKGKLRVSGSVRSILRQAHSTERELRLETLSDPRGVAAFLEGRAQIGAVVVHDHELSARFCGSDEELADLLSEIVGAGFRLRAFEPRRSGLEDILRQLDGEA